MKIAESFMNLLIGWFIIILPGRISKHAEKFTKQNVYLPNSYLSVSG